MRRDIYTVNADKDHVGASTFTAGKSKQEHTFYLSKPGGMKWRPGLWLHALQTREDRKSDQMCVVSMYFNYWEFSSCVVRYLLMWLVDATMDCHDLMNYFRSWKNSGCTVVCFLGLLYHSKKVLALNPSLWSSSVEFARSPLGWNNVSVQNLPLWETFLERDLHSLSGLKDVFKALFLQLCCCSAHKTSQVRHEMITCRKWRLFATSVHCLYIYTSSLSQKQNILTVIWACGQDASWTPTDTLMPVLRGAKIFSTGAEITDLPGISSWWWRAEKGRRKSRRMGIQ